jgi:hypothetical protein
LLKDVLHISILASPNLKHLLFKTWGKPNGEISHNKTQLRMPQRSTRPRSFNFDPLSWNSHLLTKGYSTYSSAVRKSKTTIALQEDLGAVGYHCSCRRGQITMIRRRGWVTANQHHVATSPRTGSPIQMLLTNCHPLYQLAKDSLQQELTALADSL